MVKRMKWVPQFLSCTALLLTGLTCPAQTVIFRVITDQGKPLGNRKVSIALGGSKKGEPLGRDQIAETDQNGEARFTLPSPPPEYFYYHVDIGSPYWYCGCAGLPKTEKVVQTGIVESAARKNSHKSFEAKPGEVLIVARKFTLMERLLYPIEKQ